jgi:hypothetical protein
VCWVLFYFLTSGIKDCISFFQNDSEKSRYSFNVEWYDTEASLNRTFILFYYKVDGTIELVSNLSNM